jgi:hypothetical protein
MQKLIHHRNPGGNILRFAVLISDVRFCQFSNGLKIRAVFADRQRFAHPAVQFRQITIHSVCRFQSKGLETVQCSLFLYNAHPRQHIFTVWMDALGRIFVRAVQNCRFLVWIAVTDLHGFQLSGSCPEALCSRKNGLYIWLKVGNFQHRQNVWCKLWLYK